MDVTVKNDPATFRAGFTGEDVQQRGFACAVRADEKTQLAVVHREVEIIQHCETIKADSHTARIQNLLITCHSVFSVLACRLFRKKNLPPRIAKRELSTNFLFNSSRKFVEFVAKRMSPFYFR